MYFNPLLAVEPLKIDPDMERLTNAIGPPFAILLLLFVIAGIGLGIYSYRQQRKTDKFRAENDTWFDVHESRVQRGNHYLDLERKSIEYYVCKITFSDPYQYHNDADILENFDHVKGKRGKGERGVYQAVLRLNDKAKTNLGLQEDLFKRNKNGTSVNTPYQSHIISKP